MLKIAALEISHGLQTILGVDHSLKNYIIWNAIQIFRCTTVFITKVDNVNYE